jgi:hypothetical protein
MQTKTKILIAAAVAGGIVIVSQRKKLMALVSSPVAGFGVDAPIAPPVFIQQTAAQTQGVAQIINTMVTSLAGIAGLAIAAMTLTEKRRALAKG